MQRSTRTAERSTCGIFADKDQLRTLLLNHVLKGALTTYDDLRKAKTITTLGGATISYTGTETHGITFLINDTLEVNGFGYEFPDGSVVYLLRNQLIAP
ncbi:MAG: fasciclin domain-containing protein [Anaerolineae bacterium]